jgi:beta-lactamase class A
MEIHSTELQSAIDRVQGVVGVAAKHLVTGRELGHNTRMVFFTASTLKVPLLVELYRQVDEGRIHLDQRMELTDQLRVPGSGVFKELASGLQPTIRDAAMLMIIISDNTATDLLYELVGRENLSAALKKWGLTQTRIPMTVRQLLYSAVDLDPENPDHTMALCSERLLRGEYNLESDAYDDTRSDVSSPSDMATLLEMLHSGEILSPESTESALDILKRQQLRTVIPHALPLATPAAHKTGYYLGIRADVGIVYAPNGPYTIAIMAKDITERDRVKVDLSLSDISAAIYRAFST